jgi:hypothetical protein
MQIKSQTDPATASENRAPEGQRQGFSEGAVQSMREALVRGGGSMAQFNHAEFGGPGQWMGNGMVMVGDMFNRSLAARVAALCSELTQQRPAIPETHHVSEPRPPDAWWPTELARPGATGVQDGMRYAWFPAQHRLAVEREGRLDLFDTAHHVIGGVAQQQGERSTIRFTSQDGLIDLDTLTRVTPQAATDRGDAPAIPSVAPLRTPRHSAAPEVTARKRPPAKAAIDVPPQPRATTSGLERPREPSASVPAAQPDARPSAAAAVTHEQILETLVRLGDLHRAGVLDDAEFQRKKTELLDRL